jgi:amino acid transporter
VADKEALGYERLGAPKLSLVDVVAQSVGFMGPVFSAAFLIPLIVGANAAAKGAGVAAPLSVLIAAIGIFAIGWIVAQYAKKIHAAGSLYDYVSAGLGTSVGAAAGWLYYGGTMVLTAGLGVLIGGYIHDSIFTADAAAPGVFSASSPLPVWAWSALFALFVLVVLYFGVQISTRVQLTLALISVAVVLAFFIKVIVDLGGDNDIAKAFNPSSSVDGWSGIFFGVLYGVLIFVGFETAANLAEEAAEPKRAIPRAVLLSVVVVSIFYLIAAYTQVAGFGFNLDNIFAAAGAPLFALGSPEAAGGYGSDAILKVLIVVVLLDILAVGVGAATASTRGVFAMARDRRIPGPLARVSARYGTPTGAIALMIVVMAGFIALNEFWTSLFALPETPHYFSLFIWASTFGGFALVVVYLLMSVGAFRGLAGHANMAGVVVASLIGIALTGAAIYGAFYKVPSPTLLAPWFALGWFVIGAVVTTIMRGREPASQALADLSDGGAERIHRDAPS